MVHAGGTECAKEFVVNSLCIVEKAPENSLYPLDTGGVKWLASIVVFSFQLGPGSVGDGAMFVW